MATTSDGRSNYCAREYELKVMDYNLKETIKHFNKTIKMLELRVRHLEKNSNKTSFEEFQE